MRTGAAALLAADEPKITDWLAVWFSLGSGVIAVLALIAAVIAAVATIRTNKSQSLQLERLEKSQETDLASKFGVWADNDLRRGFNIMYHNAGSLPVYDVTVDCTVVDDHCISKPGDLGPTTKPQDILKATRSVYEALNMHTDNQLERSLITNDLTRGSVEYEQFEHDLRQTLAAEIQVSVTFTDGNGITWERSDGGKLVRVESA